MIAGCATATCGRFEMPNEKRKDVKQGNVERSRRFWGADVKTPDV
jgi:hypothetical protein